MQGPHDRSHPYYSWTTLVREHLSNVKPRSKFNHQMCAMIYGSYAVNMFNVLYDTRRTLTTCKAPAHNNEEVEPGLYDATQGVPRSPHPMAGEPTTPLNRQRPISSPFLVRHTQPAAIDEQPGRNSVSVRPSVRCGGFVLRYIVQACLLRETNGAPLVHSTP